MRGKLTYKCNRHQNAFDCPDKIIYYSARFDEYGIIIHDGGSSYVGIEYCPWCGVKLPESKRDLWFDKLKALGYDKPSEQDIPKEFLTAEWYLEQL
ncbi:MAG: hypothetical protein AB1489_25040 [Acidobacteriota bacterium]